MKNLPTLSIVIPAYNEEKRIEKTIDTLLNEKNELKIKEILIVDDGSIDKTLKIVLTKSHSSNIIKLIQLETNQGKGGALREGVMRATGEYIGCFDADLSASIDSIPHAITMLENDADVVVGTRVTPQGIDLRKTQPLRRRYAGKLFSLLQRLIVGIPYKDTQCPFKLFTKEAATVIFPNLLIRRWSIDVELLALAEKNNFKIIELPIIWQHVDDSKVALGPKILINVISELLKIRHNINKLQD